MDEDDNNNNVEVSFNGCGREGVKRPPGADGSVFGMPYTLELAVDSVSDIMYNCSSEKAKGKNEQSKQQEMIQTYVSPRQSILVTRISNHSSKKDGTSAKHYLAVCGRKNEKDKGQEGNQVHMLNKPKRQLTAYNIYFQHERRRLLASIPDDPNYKGKGKHGKVGFADMAKLISRAWKATCKEERHVYIALAAQDKVRYAREKATWERAVRRNQMLLVQEAAQEEQYQAQQQERQEEEENERRSRSIDKILHLTEKTMMGAARGQEESQDQHQIFTEAVIPPNTMLGIPRTCLTMKGTCSSRGSEDHCSSLQQQEQQPHLSRPLLISSTKLGNSTTKDFSPCRPLSCGAPIGDPLTTDMPTTATTITTTTSPILGPRLLQDLRHEHYGPPCPEPEEGQHLCYQQQERHHQYRVFSTSPCPIPGLIMPTTTTDDASLWSPNTSDTSSDMKTTNWMHPFATTKSPFVLSSSSFCPCSEFTVSASCWDLDGAGAMAGAAFSSINLNKADEESKHHQQQGQLTVNTITTMAMIQEHQPGFEHEEYHHGIHDSIYYQQQRNNDGQQTCEQEQHEEDIPWPVPIGQGAKVVIFGRNQYGSGCSSGTTTTTGGGCNDNGMKKKMMTTLQVRLGHEGTSHLVELFGGRGGTTISARCNDDYHCHHKDSSHYFSCSHEDNTMKEEEEQQQQEK